jgi:hypothetical protein
MASFCTRPHPSFGLSLPWPPMHFDSSCHMQPLLFLPFAQALPSASVSLHSCSQTQHFLLHIDLVMPLCRWRPEEEAGVYHLIFPQFIAEHCSVPVTGPTSFSALHSRVHSTDQTTQVWNAQFHLMGLSPAPTLSNGANACPMA